MEVERATAFAVSSNAINAWFCLQEADFWEKVGRPFTMTLTPNAWGFVFVNMVAMSLAMVFIGKGDTVILGTYACLLF